MKKHFLSFIILALTLGFSANAWADATMPAGTYYFDFSQCTNATEFQVFNSIDNESYISFDSTNPCNAGVTKNDAKKYSSNVFSTLVIQLSTQYTKGGGFLQVKINNNWIPSNWSEYTTPTNVGTDAAKVFVCQIHNNGTYSWATSSSAIPTCGGGGDDPCPNCKTITK